MIDDVHILKMKLFINDLFDMYYPECTDINGGDLQDLAEKYDILVPTILHEPCGDFCNCAELCYEGEWKDGVKCYRLAEWIILKGEQNDFQE